jgi:NAD(P)-dependent dehydrogenase (short-subunit alcohol dehydrogenase family)
LIKNVFVPFCVLHKDLHRHLAAVAVDCILKTQFGKLDIFVSNARPEAPEFFYPPMDITLQQWDNAFDSQAKAFLVASREASALMSDGGRIIAITYAQGSRTGGLQPWVAMGSAKAAMESLVPLPGRSTGAARHHRECDQSRVDGE